MTNPWIWTSLAGAALALSLAACGSGDDDDAPLAIDAPAVVDAAPDAAAPACGAAELCARTRGECMVDITEAACLGFYEPTTTTCEDITNYTTCNCNCVEEPTCTEYFDCGTTCFEDWC